LIKYDNLKHQRFSAGIPVGTARNPQDLTELRSILKSILAHEQSYIAYLKDKFDIDIYSGTGQKAGTDVSRSIMFHDHQIIFNVMGNFSVKGEMGTGAFASAKIDIQMFFKALESEANYFESVLNEPWGRMSFIPQLVDLNFPNVKKYPKFRIEKLELENLEGLTESLNKAVQGGFIVPQREDEDWLRGLYKMPIREDDGEPITDEVKPSIMRISSGRPYMAGGYAYKKDKNVYRLQKQNQIVNQARQIVSQKRGPKVTPELLEFERKFVNLKGIDGETQRVRENLNETVRSFRNVIVADLVDRARNALSKAKSVKDLMERIKEPKLAERTKLVNAIVSESKDIFKFGRRTIKEEIQRQKVQGFQAQKIVEDASEAFKSIRPNTEAKVDAFLAKVVAEWQDEVIAQYELGELNTTQLRNAINRVSESKFQRTVGSIATKAFGLGRGVEIEKVKEITERIVRSEVLDVGTCRPCVSADGLEFSGVDDPNYVPFSSGAYTDCEGGPGACRGINVIFVG